MTTKEILDRTTKTMTVGFLVAGFLVSAALALHAYRAIRRQPNPAPSYASPAPTAS